jgi:hypothetical protein
LGGLLDMAKIELTPFIPENASYQIWHPKEFIVNEAEDGIVTITSPETFSNLTLSNYSAEHCITEEMLLDLFQTAIEPYTPLDELKSIVTDGRIWIEREFYEDNVYWIWWALSRSNRAIVASVNSENPLSPEDRHLYLFMIDKMEIYPDEEED